jgi:transcriptional regulator with XRE-family HTH domain
MRHLSGLTQPQFARHRGISVQALRQIESGTGNPTVKTLDAIAGVFGLRVGFVPKAGE